MKASWKNHQGAHRVLGKGASGVLSAGKKVSVSATAANPREIS